MERVETKIIVVHCSDTTPSMDHVNEDEIRQWHIARGWEDAGYNVVIPRRPSSAARGYIEIARPLDSRGAHVAGYNAISLGVCLVGGKSETGEPENNFLAVQLEALRSVLRFCLRYAPMAKICGHNFLDSRKTCPNFDVRSWAQSAGLPVLEKHDEIVRGN